MGDADPGFRVEEFLDHSRFDKAEPIWSQHANRVSSEHRHYGRNTVVHELARVADVRRREKIDRLAVLDALTH